ncbi:hypothetical protein SFRURICE_001869 [Spodoptera frugiperda]|nr:hypothetical protein SFRURICE_001869 [Spodoptera frugiperda]
MKAFLNYNIIWLHLRFAVLVESGLEAKRRLSSAKKIHEIVEESNKFFDKFVSDSSDVGVCSSYCKFALLLLKQFGQEPFNLNRIFKGRPVKIWLNWSYDPRGISALIFRR